MYIISKIIKFKDNKGVGYKVMESYQLNYLKDKLMDELKQAEATLKSRKESSFEGSLKDGIEELSMYDNHPADIASELYEQQKEFALANHENERIADIKEALRKIDNNTYGVCDFCGEEIPFERLEAYPTAKLCIKCQKEKQLDLEELDRDRPVEEEVLKYPFGRTFTDRRDYTGYDGEDTWQDVQQYGSSSGPQDISVNRPIKYNNAYYDSDENPGIVDMIDKIDGDDYKEQLPDS